MAAKLKIDRGTTYRITFNYQKNGSAETLAGATVRFTVKSEEYDNDAADTSALISKNITSHVDDAGGESLITLTPSDTYIEPGEYYYDIKVQEASGEIYKAAEGIIEIDGSPTNRTA